MAALCTGVGVKQIASNPWAFAVACIDGKVGAWGRSGCTQPKGLAGLEPFDCKTCVRACMRARTSTALRMHVPPLWGEVVSACASVMPRTPTGPRRGMVRRVCSRRLDPVRHGRAVHRRWREADHLELLRVRCGMQRRQGGRLGTFRLYAAERPGRPRTVRSQKRTHALKAE